MAAPDLVLSLPDSSGIYAIRCLPSAKLYVGSALSIRSRWLIHRGLLRSGKHPNPKLQKSWDRHGEASFACEVLEILEQPQPGQLVERERAWIADLKPGLNLALDPRKGKKLLSVAVKVRVIELMVALVRRRKKLGRKDATREAVVSEALLRLAQREMVEAA